MKKKPMPQTQTKVKTGMDIKIKISLLFALASSLCLAAGMLTVVLKIPLQKSSSVTAVVKVNEFDKTIGAEYSPNRMLVKFKEGIDAKAVLQQALEGTFQVYQNKTTKKILASDSQEYLNLRNDPEKMNLFQLKEVKYSLKKIDKAFTLKSSDSAGKESVDSVAMGKQLNQWEQVELNEPEVDIYALQQKILATGQVEKVEPDYVYKVSAKGLNSNTNIELEPVPPNDPYFDSVGSWGQDYADLWGLKSIRADAAWRLTGGSKDIVIAVTDSGVDYTHPDLQANIWKNEKEIPANGIDDDNNGYIDDYYGYDFCTYGDCAKRDSDPKDENGHGTHVAGIIAAAMNNQQGIIGICPSCRIMAVRGLNAQGSGLASDLAEAIKYAADNGAKVINMSWGGSGDSQLVRDAVDYAHAKNVVLVAAAGNSNDNVDLYSPARYPNVIAVAALDHNLLRSDFSNWGDKIEVTAPGGDGNNAGKEPSPYLGRNILSLRASGTDMYGDGYSIVGENYYRSRGTSMAAPFVAGVAGLILSRQPGFTNEQVRAAINQSAVDMGEPGWDQYTGHGRLDAMAAVQITNPLMALIFSPAEIGLYRSNDKIRIEGSAGGGDFSGYTVEISPEADATKKTVITSSNTPVENGLLAIWEPGQLIGNYRIKLTVSTISGKKISTFRRAIMGFEAGWPQQSSQIIASHLAAVDIDPNYPGLELVGASSSTNIDGQVELFARHADGSMLPGWPITLANESFTVSSGPAVGDIDHDGNYEIIIATNTKKVYAFHCRDLNGDGQIDMVSGWPKTVSGTVTVVPTLADIDNDGFLEVIAPTYQGQLYVWRYNGEPYSEAWPQTIGKDPACSVPVAVGNLDGDQDLEIVAAGGYMSNKVYVFNPDGSQLNSQWPKKIMTINNYPTLADLNNDHRLEIVLSGRYMLSAYLASGEQLFNSISHNMYYSSPAAVGDLDRNSPGNEIVAVGEDKVYVWNSAGALLNGNWPKTLYVHGIPYVNFTSSPAIADLNGDGEMEIIIGTDRFLFALNKDGQTLSESWPINLRPWWQSPMTTGYTTPLAGDVDNDKKLEVFIANIDYVYGFEVSSSGLSAWPRYQHDPQNTGRFQEIVCADGTSEGKCNASSQLCFLGNLIKIGDLNNDQAVNPLDVVLLSNYVLKGAPLDNTALAVADVNADKIINVADVTYLINYVYKGGSAPKCP